MTCAGSGAAGMPFGMPFGMGPMGFNHPLAVKAMQAAAMQAM